MPYLAQDKAIVNTYRERDSELHHLQYHNEREKNNTQVIRAT